MFGTAGLPHILMRFFTVNDAKAARKSVFLATGFIGYFYILTFIIGFGAIVLVAPTRVYHDGGAVKGALLGGGNMPAIHLAHAVGGDLFLGFISAVAFATILAVVSGLTLAGASAISHDLYASVFRHGRVDERGNARVADRHGRARHLRDHARHRVREDQRRLHGRPRLRSRRQREFPGAAAVDVVARPDHARRLLRRLRRPDLGGGADCRQPRRSGKPCSASRKAAPVPLRVAGDLLDALAFIVCWLVSITDKSKSAIMERAAFEAQFVRSQTGIGAEGAAVH